MKVLLYSSRFAPSVGGIEECTSLLACTLSGMGHEITVATETPEGSRRNDYPFRLVRGPSWSSLYALAREHDVSLHGCISLKALPPFIAALKPVVVVHHTWYLQHDGKICLSDLLKKGFTKGTINICVSNAIARQIPAPSTVIHNPYNDSLFQEATNTHSEGLLYVGRLVSDKGVPILLQALKVLHSNGHPLTLTIVGEGPEKRPLQLLTEALGLQNSVQYTGSLQGEPLAQCYQRHKVLVVPSIWEEPFGMTVLEGLASGCAVIASRAGGLPEALGDCGLLFTKGDHLELARGILELYNRELTADLRTKLSSHLANHTRQIVAQQYEKLLREAAHEN